MDQDDLMSTADVAARLGIAPQSVRTALRRYGITEVRGYRRSEVEALRRHGRGRRTDLRRDSLSGEPRESTE